MTQTCDTHTVVSAGSRRLRWGWVLCLVLVVFAIHHKNYTSGFLLGLYDLKRTHESDPAKYRDLKPRTEHAGRIPSALAHDRVFSVEQLGH